MPKLRPVIGHEAEQERLKLDIAQENVSHGYLFSGPEHLGKMSLALSFAADLLCLGADKKQQAVIRSQIERLTHPDLLVLDQLWMEEVCEDWEIIAKSSNAPQVHRSKKPAARTDVIGIDDIRALQDQLYGAATGQFRCCIIRSIERMHEAAANAFLKILEEPPRNLVFILTTELLEAVPPTIISRTRVLNFRRLPINKIRGILTGLEEEDVRFILHVSHGAPGIAAALADDPDLLRAHRMAHATASSFWNSGNSLERLKIVSALHERGAEADMLLVHLGLTLRERMPKANVQHLKAFSELTRDLGTNAHRELLAQRFALSVVNP